MLIFNIITKPEKYSVFAIDKEVAGVFLRIKACNYKNKSYITLKITLTITDEQILTRYMKNYLSSYFVVEDEKLITSGVSDKKKTGEYLDIDVVDKEINDVIKPFEYSGDKDLIFKRGG